MPPRANEEDVDDLDDVLEEFNKTTPTPPAPRPSTTTIPVPSGPSRVESSSLRPDAESLGDEALQEEFAKQFAAEWEAMMRTLSKPSGSKESDEDKQLREAWEKMIISDLEGAGRGNEIPLNTGSLEGQRSTQKQKQPGDSSLNDDPFQKVIQQAMEKLHGSDEALKADSKNPESKDPLENFLSSLSLEDGEEEGLDSALETIMSTILTKEILYEPLKELHTKYPEYLKENKSSLPPEEFERYTQQNARVSQIVAIFEKDTYSDEDPTISAEILKFMNEMQSFGSPPTEIMGDMPPGMDFGADGLPKLPEGCIIC